MPDTLRISRLVHEGFFYRFRVSIHHRQAGAHRAFGTRAPLLPFLERARADGVAQTAVFAVCGSSLRFTLPQPRADPVLEICGFPYGRTEDPKGGGPRYPD